MTQTFPCSFPGVVRAARRSAVLSTLVLAGAAWAFGNPDGNCTVPAAAQPDSIANPTTVIGTGTPASCTSAAFVAAVAKGGVITFNCGPDPFNLVLSQTAKVFNDRPNVVIDGGNKITLTGAGVRRILYQNTCDPAQHWTSDRCDIQDNPHLTVQNISFFRGNSTGQTYGRDDVYGGGAIFVRGGRFKAYNARFIRNSCESTGPDLGGAAIRVFQTSPEVPVYISNSTFGGSATNANVCSNGGAISSLVSSVSVYNSLITYNQAVGYGANPARPGTPGGGSGGAIYQDGNTFSLRSCGNKIENNHAKEGGGAFFFVSNDLTGTMTINQSTLIGNPSDTFETDGLPGIFILAKPGQPVVKNSVISR